MRSLKLLEYSNYKLSKKFKKIYLLKLPIIISNNSID